MRFFIVPGLFILFSILSLGVFSAEVQWTLTTLNKENLLNSKPSFSFETTACNNAFVINVDSSKKYQTMRGIGSSMEASTCFNLNRLTKDRRQEVYQKLFDEENGIGLNLMRITIGTSDFCPLPFYSYDDMPAGSKDPLLRNFNTTADESYIIPILQEVLQYSKTQVSGGKNKDDLQFFASPWSGPGFMKTSDKLEGGSLLPTSDESYSNYLLQFIKTYRDHYKIPVIAITPQNEPLANQEYPSILLPPGHERDIISNSLGAKLLKESIEIWCFDHNWNTLFYPRTILNDSTSYQYVSGTAFHGYRGQPTAMTELHEQFPDKDIYFTEGSTFGIRGAIKIVEILRNWARTYNAWVTILDTELQPNAGPFNPQPTMIQIDAQQPNDQEIIYNFEFFMYGQFSKFIRRGAIRIGSEDAQESEKRVPSPQIESLQDAIIDAKKARSNDEEDDGRLRIHHIAFQENEKTTLIVVNPFQEEQLISIVDVVQFAGQSAQVTVPPLSVSTFVW
jgi:beta-glucosidase